MKLKLQGHQIVMKNSSRFDSDRFDVESENGNRWRDKIVGP